MAFTPTYRTRVRYKAVTGRPKTLNAISAVSAAAADGLATATLKIKSGEAVISASRSVDADPTGFTLGHSDGAARATFVYKISGRGGTFDETLEEISDSYKDGILDDGTISVTNTDIAAFFAARSTATGLTYVPQSAHFD